MKKILFITTVILFILIIASFTSGTFIRESHNAVPAPSTPTPWATPSCCIRHESYQVTSETGAEVCNNGIDDDCDGKADDPDTYNPQYGRYGDDPQCCTDDEDPCTRAILNEEGRCAHEEIADCKYCFTKLDCIDGNDDTYDICVSGRCVNMEE